MMIGVNLNINKIFINKCCQFNNQLNFVIEFFFNVSGIQYISNNFKIFFLIIFNDILHYKKNIIVETFN